MSTGWTDHLKWSVFCAQNVCDVKSSEKYNIKREIECYINKKLENVLLYEILRGGWLNFVQIAQMFVALTKMKIEPTVFL